MQNSAELVQNSVEIEQNNAEILPNSERRKSKRPSTTVVFQLVLARLGQCVTSMRGPTHWGLGFRFRV